MSNPFFSVVIPTHNRLPLLIRAIDSVLKQTFKDFELIVVDDHSSDNTGSVVKTISDPRVKYTLNKRIKGACGARNVGIFSSKGKWVAFLDDDDEWLPDKLFSQYNLIQNSDTLTGMICTDYALIKGTNHKPIIIKNRPEGWIHKKLLYGYQIGCLSSVVVRSVILRNINGFDERFKSNQDWDLWYRISKISKVDNVPRVLVKMYQEIRKDRIGQNYNAKLSGHILLREKYSDIIDKNKILRHRHESFIFTYAVLSSNKQVAIKNLRWFLFGVVIDFFNFVRIFRSLIILLHRKHFSNIS